MAFQHQHIRSSQKGRRPIANDLIPGQLAVNFNDETPGIFFESETGQIIKSGPTHIGTSPPPLVKQSEYSIGELWFDLNEGIIKIFTTGGWRATSLPVDGDLKGEPGIKGDQGEKGNRGYDGQDGKKGQKGEKFYFYELTENEKNEIKGEKGFQGDQGDPGTSVVLKGAVADLNELNQIPLPIQGDLYVVENDGLGVNNTYVWDGSSWVLVGPIQGPKGDEGEKGEPLLFSELTQSEVDSLKGEPGQKGDPLVFNDLTPAQLEAIKGEPGPAGADGASVKGEPGDPGPAGLDGNDGDSAYDSAVKGGFSGTEAEWVQTIKGDSAYQSAVNSGYQDTEAKWVASLKGQKGEPGASGFSEVTGDYVDLTGATMTGDLVMQGPDDTWEWPSTLSHNSLTGYNVQAGTYEKLRDDGTQPGRFSWLFSQSSGMSVKISPHLTDTSGISVWNVQPVNPDDPFATSTEVHRITKAGMGFFRGGLRTGGNTGSTSTFQALDDGQVSMRHFLNIEVAGGLANTLQYKADKGLFIGNSAVSGETDLELANNVAITIEGNATFAGTVSASQITKSGVEVATVDDLSSVVTGYATENYVSTAISNLIDSAPGTLDTLNEIAAAIGNDADYASSISSQIAEVNADVQSLVTALGIAENDENMGAFTTTVLTDSVNLKTALEAFGSAYETRVTTVDNAIAAVQADVDQNELDSDAADLALSNRLDILEADPTTATDVAAVQADVDQNEADADAAIALKADIADPTFTGVVKAGDMRIQDGGQYSQIVFAQRTGTSIEDGLAWVDIAGGPQQAKIVRDDSSEELRFYSAGAGGGSTPNFILNPDATAEFSDAVSIAGALTLGGTEITATATELNLVGDLGTFTGTTIADNQNVKDALQDLEDKVEVVALLDGSNVPGPYASDNDAATGGVPVGGLYKHSGNGQIHWRVS